MTKRKKNQPTECISYFIILNEHTQVWTGIKGDDLAFSDDWNEAKPLETEIQFGHLKRMTHLKLEQVFL